MSFHVKVKQNSVWAFRTGNAETVIRAFAQEFTLEQAKELSKRILMTGEKVQVRVVYTTTGKPVRKIITRRFSNMKNALEAALATRPIKFTSIDYQGRVYTILSLLESKMFGDLFTQPMRIVQIDNVLHTAEGDQFMLHTGGQG